MFQGRLERQYIYEMRRVNKDEHGIECEDRFYRKVLSVTTRNIRNLVTIPHVVQGYLMRRGYVYRHTAGDLSAGGTVYDGFTKARKGTGRIDSADRKKLNKFVVLRRWQSFNPKIPRPGGWWVRGGGYFLMWHGRGLVIDPGYDFIQNFYDEGFSLEDIDAVIISHSHPDHDDDFSEPDDAGEGMERISRGSGHKGHPVGAFIGLVPE